MNELNRKWFKRAFPLIYILCLSFIKPTLSQDEIQFPKHQILASFHLGNYIENNQFTDYNFTPAFGIEYRKIIKSFSEKWHLSLGLNLEMLAVKRIHENDDFYLNKQYNLTIPLGIYFTASNGIYLGVFTSFDIPFANGENSQFGTDSFKHHEFSPRFLNLNFSAGANVGKVFSINDRVFLLELHYKSLALLGLRENDYWLYPEGAYPYYFGIKLGIGIQ